MLRRGSVGNPRGSCQEDDSGFPWPADSGVVASPESVVDEELDDVGPPVSAGCVVVESDSSPTAVSAGRLWTVVSVGFSAVVVSGTGDPAVGGASE